MIFEVQKSNRALVVVACKKNMLIVAIVKRAAFWGQKKGPMFTWKGYHLAILNLVYPTMLFGEKLGSILAYQT